MEADSQEVTSDLTVIGRRHHQRADRLWKNLELPGPLAINGKGAVWPAGRGPNRPEGIGARPEGVVGHVGRGHGMSGRASRGSGRAIGYIPRGAVGL